MVPERSDPLTKAPVPRGERLERCRYCIASHGAAARNKHAEAQYSELLAIRLANETNRLVTRST